MKRKLKTLTEQFTDARTNYNRVLGRSDKQLMNEQMIPCPPGEMRLRMTPCPGSTYTTGGLIPPGSTWYTGGCATIDGQQPTQANVGNIFGLSQTALHKWELLEILPSYNQIQNPSQQFVTSTCNSTQPQGDWWCDPNAPNPSANMCVQSVNQPQSYFTGPYPTQSDCEQVCTNPTPTTGCDQSAWSNYSNWESTFTSLPNFTSSNPNQPCQFLCQRETQWSNQIQNVGPNWANQLQCKLDKVQDLMQTHNCASSNAPAC